MSRVPVRGCLCADCKLARQELVEWMPWQFASRLSEGGYGVPEGSDHGMQVKGHLPEDNLITFRWGCRPHGSVVGQPMILFKGVGDSGVAHVSCAEWFEGEKRDHEAWKDLEWNPEIRL